MFSLCIFVDGASTTTVDQSTCQETLENLVQAFQKVVDLQSRVSPIKSYLVGISTEVLKAQLFNVKN